MSSANCPETPRQKMISMMYIVLTAMLALNVSTDVLNGFTLVQESLEQTIENTNKQNKAQYSELAYLKTQNPKKVGVWLDKANRVHAQTDSLYNQIQRIKVKIVKAADGKDGKVDSIIGKDNTDAASIITYPSADFPKMGGEAADLVNNINAYADSMVAFVKNDSTKISIIRSNFDTSKKKNPSTHEVQTWAQSRFESMPAAAAITLLTKSQADLRNTEAEVVGYLKNQVDAGDFRVNKITAEVISKTSYITRGGTYEADIILAAIDSTKRPKITVNGAVLKKGESKYAAKCNKVGTFNIKGVIELPRADGSIQPYEFESSYIVGEPTAIISADMMNVLYAGIANPVSVSVPGVPSSKIAVSITNGKLSRKGGKYSIRPKKVGKECRISVSIRKEGGKTQRIACKPFRVKALPPPVAFVACKDQHGNAMRYRGEKPIKKGQLLGAKGIQAKLDDADLDVKYRVLGFRINFMDAMGNSVTRKSEGGKFTKEQKQLMRKLSRGKKFYIVGIKAKGPDGLTRNLGAIEVTIK